MGVSIVMGVPQMVGFYFMENPNLKWILTGHTPISGNLHIRTSELCQAALPSAMCGTVPTTTTRLGSAVL